MKTASKVQASITNMRILFVCTVNRFRSRTAEDHFRKTRPEHEYRSCGTDAGWIVAHRDESDKMVPISRELCEWAERIVCMEKAHAKVIRKRFGESEKCITLHIPDRFEYMEPELIRLLEERFSTEG